MASTFILSTFSPCKRNARRDFIHERVATETRLIKAMMYDPKIFQSSYFPRSKWKCRYLALFKDLAGFADTYRKGQSKPGL